MKKLVIALFCTCFVCILVSCATAAVNPALMPSTGEKTVSGNAPDIPEWALVDKSDSEYRYATGSSNHMDRNIALKDADLNARAELAAEIKSDIAATVANAAKSLSDGTTEQYYTEFASNFEQNVQVELVGCKRMQVYYANDGYVWVQVGIPVNNIQGILDTELNKMAGTESVSSGYVDLAALKSAIDGQSTL